jgi:hypothetical protein
MFQNVSDMKTVVQVLSGSSTACWFQIRFPHATGGCMRACAALALAKLRILLCLGCGWISRFSTETAMKVRHVHSFWKVYGKLLPSFTTAAATPHPHPLAALSRCLLLPDFRL